MACDARWPRAERGGQMSLYGCLSAEAVTGSNCLDGQLPTQSGQNDFPKAASQPQQGSANRNAPTLPLATSPNRPIAALQPSVKVIIGQTALLRLQTLMLKVARRIEQALST